MQKIKRRCITIIALLLCILLVILAAGAIYCKYGGFSTGQSANAEEFEKYAKSVSEITVPGQAKIIALGEATHGNAEFQQLRLDVFKIAVEKFGVRAFALEADFGGCRAVNDYVHDGSGTAGEAVFALGFDIYQTQQTEDLVKWIRDFNKAVTYGRDIRFYGFDMQKYAYSYEYLIKTLKELGADVSKLEELWDGDSKSYARAYTSDQRSAIIKEAKEGIKDISGQKADLARQFADVLLQNIELGKHMGDGGGLNACRDKFMAQNAQWIYERERQRGNVRLFVSGHNNHIRRSENQGEKVMGSILFENFGDGYFAIGTDFYRSECNLKSGIGISRKIHTFYSHDPLAKASKQCGYAQSYLDFSDIPLTSPLDSDISSEMTAGSLGDVYNGLYMNFLPGSYRMKIVPKSTYNGMIFVSSATPTTINFRVG